MKKENIISHNNIFAGKKTHGSCPPTIGKRIRDCREAKELSIEAFAMELGKSYEYVVAYENDRRNPKEDTLEEMAKILGTSSDYLKYGFIRRSYVSDDKMYEFEYRDLPSNETNAKENISKINECINTIKKYKKYERVNYLQILEDFAEHLSLDSMSDACKAVPEEFEDLSGQFLTHDEYVEALKKK